LATDTGTKAQAREFHPIDYVKITIFGFGLSGLWSSLHTVILPLRLLDFVPEVLKNTYLDLLVLAGVLLAMVVQPIAGAISDRSSASWGRRRPYILLGAMLTLLFLPGIGLSGSYLAVFVTYCLLQVSANTAQGPFQGFIPDLAPAGKRGLASGVRSLLNIIGGIALVRLIAPLMDRYFAGGGSAWLWLALAIPAIVLLAVLVTTMLTVKEQPGSGRRQLPFLSTLYRSFRVDVRASPGFLSFLVSCFLIFAAWGTLMAHALYYLMDVVGIGRPGEAVGDFLIVIGGCMLAAVYPAGRLSDRVGRKPIAISSGLFGALGIVALFFSQSYVPVMLSGSLLGICGGAWMSSQWALAIDLTGRGEEARFLGLVNVSVAGAGALSRLVGPLIDFFNQLTPRLGYEIMLLICFVCLVAGSLLLARVRTTA